MTYPSPGYIAPLKRGKEMKITGSLTVVLTAMLIIALAAVTASAADSHAASAPINPPGAVNAAEAYSQLNSCRSRYNMSVKKKSKKLGTVKRDRTLEKIAMVRAREMAETGRFSHTRPNGKRGISLVKGRKAKGENIARGQTTCAEVTAAWYASPGHRANMLRKNFRKVGIAGYTCNGVTYWAQVYSS